MIRVLLSIYFGLFSFCLFSQTVYVGAVTSPSCYGQCNGDVSFSITGATGPFSVSVTNTLGCINPVMPSFTNTNVTFSNMCACQYFFTFYDGTSSVIDTKAVNITQPNVLLLNASPNTIICYGQTTQIYCAGAGGTPPYSYLWNPSTLIGGGPFNVSPTITTQYTSSVSDANGCTSAPQVITLTVRAQLLALGNTTTVCDGDSASLIPNITSLGIGGPYTYNWSEGSTTNSITVAATFSSTPKTYSVTINDGCTVPGAVAVFTINSGPALYTGVNVTAAACATCCNGNAQFAVSSAVPYSVTLNPGSITTQTATNLCVGVYTYCASNGTCSSCRIFMVANSIGMKEYQAEIEINIYPNPSNGKINITSSEENSQMSYEIYDIIGGIITSGKIADVIDIGEINNGVYILEMKRPDGIIVTRKKLSIQLH
jgi:hypothetical protein